LLRPLPGPQRRLLVETMGGLIAWKGARQGLYHFWVNHLVFRGYAVMRPIVVSRSFVPVISSSLCGRGHAHPTQGGAAYWNDMGMRFDASEKCRGAAAMLCRRAAAAAIRIAVMLYYRSARATRSRWRARSAPPESLASRAPHSDDQRQRAGQRRAAREAGAAYVAKPVGHQSSFDVDHRPGQRTRWPLARPLRTLARRAPPPAPVPPEKRRKRGAFAGRGNFLNMNLTMSQYDDAGFSPLNSVPTH